MESGSPGDDQQGISASRLLRIAGLGAGFVLGQGSVFVALTWLVGTGQVQAVGSIGFGFAILSLVQFTADWGGTQLLAKHAATGGPPEYLCAMLVARLAISVPITACGVGFGLYFTKDPLIHGMLVTGSFAAVIWSLNLQGYLDGLGRNALSGPLSGISWLLASVGLFFVNLDAPMLSGVVVGGLFVAGAIFTVACHYVIAAKTKARVSFAFPSWSGIAEAARDGGLLTLAELPTQFFGRMMIFLVLVHLGPTPAGVYVYVRNILTAAIQGLVFVIRVEFPRVARSAVGKDIFTFGEVVGLHRWSLTLAVLMVAGLLGLCLTARPLLPASFWPILDTLPVFLVLIPAFGLTTAFGQAAIARHTFGHYALAASLSTLVGAGVVLATIDALGLLSTVAGELSLDALRIAYFLWLVTGRPRDDKALRASLP